MGSSIKAVLCALLVTAGCSSSPGPAPAPQAPAAAAVKPSPPVVMPKGPAAKFHLSHLTSAGPVMVTTLKGAKSGVTGKVWVWTPPQYKDPRYAHSGFPVLMLHTGSTGVNYNFWAHENVVPTQAAEVRLVKAGKAVPFIMVMPILQVSKAQDTECSDRAGQPRMDTWLAEDVADMVKANFRTLPGRDGWGMAGASSGAFCAVKLTLHHPDRFKAAASWGGYFVPQPETPPRWSPQEMQANSADQLVRARPDVRLLLLAGSNPRFRADVTRMNAFVQLVRPPTVATTYIQPGGGHYTEDLKKLLPNILEFLSKNLHGPVPA